MKDLFLNSWIAKLASLLIAVMIWYVIKSNLVQDNISYPVPGTDPGTSPIESVPVIEDIISSPLAPPPVPGSKSGS